MKTSLILVMLLMLPLGCGTPPEPTRVDTSTIINQFIETGDKFASAGSHDSAIDEYLKAREQDRTNAVVVRKLRNAYQTKGDMHNASECAETLVTMGDRDKQNFAILADYNSKNKNHSLTYRYTNYYLKKGGDERIAEDYISKLMLDKKFADLTDVEKQAIKDQLKEILAKNYQLP